MKHVVAMVVLVATGGLLAGFCNAETIGERIAKQAEVGGAVTAVGQDSFAGVSVTFPDGVTGYPNVTYQTLMGYRPMTIDVFLPPKSFDDKGPRPWVMYVHGGGWVMGGPRRSGAYLDWPKVLASLAAEGYVVASVSYRFAKEAPFPAAIQDVKAAIRFLRVNAAKYHLDPNRGVTWGQSAGGHLSALAAVTCGVTALDPPARSVPNAANVETAASSPEGADQVSDCVQGAVAWYGIYDLTKAYREHFEKKSGPNVNALFLGCHDGPCSGEALREASPITYVDAKDPPIFLMHGTDDTTVNPQQSKEFEAALKAAGVRTDLVMIPGVGHSWVGKAPGSTQAASKQALQQSIDFIQSLIGDKTTGH